MYNQWYYKKGTVGKLYRYCTVIVNNNYDNIYIDIFKQLGALAVLDVLDSYLIH